MRNFAAIALFLTLAPGAWAQTVTVQFTGTVLSVTGELNGIVATNDVLTGSLTYEASTAGTYTPSPNTTFVRAEMLHTGAITAFDFTLVGDTVSGTSGDIEIFDALEMLAGDDSWEVTAVPGTGTIGGKTPTSFFFNPSYAYTSYTISPGDPVATPLPFAASSFRQFSLATSGGGTAYGQIDDYQVVGAPAVPVLGGWGILALSAGLGALGAGFRSDLGRSSA